MIGTLSTAISGLFSAAQKINSAAKNVANIGDGITDEGASLPRDIVDIKIGTIEYKANLAIIKATEEMSNELLKTFDETI